jgi:hypothetical protein
MIDNVLKTKTQNPSEGTNECLGGVRTKDAMASLEKCNVDVEARGVHELNNW